MTPTALKLIGFLPLFAFAQVAGATDSSQPEALARWQADKTVILDAADIELKTFKWQARPVIIFADSPNDPAFKRQLELLNARTGELVERDVVLIIDTDPETRSALRTRLRPRGFMLTLIGKDGGVKLRKPFPWDVRELTRQIDKMPIRRQEIIDEKAAARER
ncbi:MAG: DUF4174 domain-containing protein [Silicimonas sp.]|jgi:hypothetical protein|nr:DUF4174 domain-containing protein [Silicimonas sp.]